MTMQEEQDLEAFFMQKYEQAAKIYIELDQPEHYSQIYYELASYHYK